MSLDGTILDIYDFPIDDEQLTATDMIIESEGSAVVVGYRNFSSRDVFIHKIDLQTGTILNKSELSTGAYESSSPRIISTENGYVLGEIGEAESNGVSISFFSISFLDQDFNFLTRTFHQATIYNDCYLQSFIPMRSGGFCALSFTCNGPLTIFRLDDVGNELWRWEGGFNPGGGSLVGSIIESSDGGIIFLGTKEFNSSGYKIVTIKLDANGDFL